MLKDPRAALLSRHLPAGWTLAEELGLLTLQTPEKQQIVEDRLTVIDRFLTKGGAQSADTAANEIGVGRRQFYMLLSKLRGVGPTRALAPGFRNVERASVARNGLGEPAESLLRKILSEEPEAKIARIEARMREALNGAENSLPSETAIRRRVHALRRSGAVPNTDLLLGAHIVMDQVALDLSIREGGANVLAIVTLIIDRDARAILGAGLTGSDDQGIGLKAALVDFQTRIQSIYEAGLPIAPQLEKLTWVVPPVGVFAVVNEEKAPKLEIVETGAKRHGEAILRLLGDRLPPFRFRRLAWLERQPLITEAPGMDLEDARQLLSASVDNWNAELQSAQQTAHQMPNGVRQHRLQLIVDTLVDLVLHVHVLEDEDVNASDSRD